MNRRSLAGTIVLVWLGALSWLGFREIRAASAPGVDNSLRTVPPGAAYYVVTVEELVVGYASRTVDTVPEGIRVDDRLMLELPSQEGVARTDVRTVANLTNTFDLSDFETTVGSDGGGFVSSGVMSSDETLGLAIQTPEITYAMDIDMSAPVVMEIYLPLRVAFGPGLSLADTMSVVQFDPVHWDQKDLKLEVLADSTIIFPDSAVWDSIANIWIPARWDTLRAWKVRQTTEGQNTVMWIDELGQLVSVASASGFHVTRTAFEIAFHNFRNRAIADGATTSLMHQTPIAAGIRSLPSDRSELRVAIGKTELATASLNDGRQTLTGNTLTIRRDEGNVLRSTFRLPAAPNGSSAQFLESTSVYQSADPRIQARARLIVDGTRNASRATRRLVNWLFENLDKQPGVGVPNALSVLATEAGDSYEHATLFIGLARAVGLPTKPAAGLLFANGRFYYHVWAEVDLGSGWVAVDPTFGQFPADASHIRFTNTLPAGNIEMVRLIGNPRLAPVSEEEFSDR